MGLPLRLEATVVINEILASNQTGIRDGFGERSDWIELYNRSNRTVDLRDWVLTDDLTTIDDRRFPSLNLAPGEFLMVFAGGDQSGQLTQPFLDDQRRLHLPFRLRAVGEPLYLVAGNGNIVSRFDPNYPPQFTDVSFGIGNAGKLQYFPTPTPGGPNASGTDGVVQAVTFSSERGFYTDAFELTLSSETERTVIYYTMDGSEPSLDNGLRYSEPILIDSNVTVRARAFRSRWASVRAVSHSYIFLSQVVQQPKQPGGFPSDWGTNGEVPGRVVADYEMDPRVVQNTRPGYSVEEALLDIPTMSLSLPVDDFLGPSRGIYTHPQSRGNSWERVCSVELIHPDGEEGFQVDAELEIHGNSSRRPWRMQKHSMRLTFRGELGTPRLRYPLFRDSPVASFNKLVLRACFTDSWGLVSWGASRYRPNDSQYVRDLWMKESLREMGHPSSYGDWVHLYINGLYWGIYNVAERIDDDFFADHLGGQASDWEVVEDLSGNPAGWSQLMATARRGAGLASVSPLLDLDSFADYMLLHFYADAEDWPHHNGYVARNRAAGKPFQFFVWDQEIVLDNLRMRRYDNGSSGSPGELFQLLRRDQAFRLFFADRVYHHLHGDGGLGLTASQERYRRVSDRIDKAIVAESARWGDTQMSTPYGNRLDQPSNPNNVEHPHYPPAPNGPDYYFTREQSWLVERANVLENYLPAIYDTSRSDSLIRELRSEDLYPSIDPPAMLPRNGVAPSFMVELRARDGEAIHYTLDGSDPFQPVPLGDLAVLLDSGNRVKVLIPTGAELGKSWTETYYDDTGWRPGPFAIGYEATSGPYTSLIDFDVKSMYQRSPSIYLRSAFEVERATIDRLEAVILNLRYDDGFVAYLNGVKVAEANAPASPRWNSSASGSHIDSSAVNFSSFPLTVGPQGLREGVNVLALHGLNASATSSDFLIEPQLVGRERGEALAPTQGFVYEEPIAIESSVVLKARSRLNGEWSALTVGRFVVGERASGENLVVSELHYNPSESEGVEFIELLNINPEAAVDLSGASFTSGIRFTFNDDTLLQPGAVLLLVSDLDQLPPSGGSAFEFEGALDNGGETIELTASDGSNVFRFSYDDKQPWPIRADGEGSSLVLINPFSRPDLNHPQNWRSSGLSGGSPGTLESSLPPSDPNFDEDGDGLSAGTEFVLGLDDQDASINQSDFTFRVVERDGSSHLWMSFPVRLGVTFDFIFERSESLQSRDWVRVEFEALSSELPGDGRVVFRSLDAIDENEIGYLRISAKVQNR